jgi:hypothetical protein
MKKIITMLVPLLAAAVLAGCYYDPYWHGPHLAPPPPRGRIVVPLLPPPRIVIPPPAIFIHP